MVLFAVLSTTAATRRHSVVTPHAAARRQPPLAQLSWELKWVQTKVTSFTVPVFEEVIISLIQYRSSCFCDYKGYLAEKSDKVLKYNIFIFRIDFSVSLIIFGLLLLFYQLVFLFDSISWYFNESKLFSALTESSFVGNMHFIKIPKIVCYLLDI